MLTGCGSPCCRCRVLQLVPSIDERIAWARIYVLFQNILIICIIISILTQHNWSFAAVKPK